MASSGTRPPSTTRSAALHAASKPDAALARAMDLSVCPAAGGVHAVDALDQPLGHVPPYRGLAERARPGDDRRDERQRVAHGGPGAVGPREHRHPAAAVGDDLHRVGAHPDEQLPAVPRRAGDVLAAVGLDVAALVRPGPHPPHRVERGAGQRAHLGEVLAQGLRRRAAVAAPRRGVQARAPLRQQGVQLGERPDPGHRHEEVAPQVADRVLHRPLLVARVWVAVPRLDAVVPPEQGEQLGLRHLAADHPARLGRVVQDQHPRGAAPAREDRREPRAQALRPLRPQGDALPVVGVGKRRHQQLEGKLLARDDGAEVAEVHLAGARRPLQLQVALARAGRAGEPPLAHEALDGRVGAGVAPLPDQPVVDPPGGVALLARRAEVGLQDRLDPPRVLAERGPLAPRRHGGGGRHVLHVGVLRDGVAADAEPAGDLGPRHAVGVHRPYIIPCVQGHGHLLHPSRAASPKCPPGTTLRRGPRPWSGGRGPRDQTAQFLVHALLRNRRSFGPLPIAHQQAPPPRWSPPSRWARTACGASWAWPASTRSPTRAGGGSCAACASGASPACSA